MLSNCNHQLPATLEKIWTFTNPRTFYKVRGLTKVSDPFSFSFDPYTKFWFRVESSGDYPSASLVLECNNESSFRWYYQCEIWEELEGQVIGSTKGLQYAIQHSNWKFNHDASEFEIHCKIVYTLDGCPYCEDERKKNELKAAIYEDFQKDKDEWNKKFSNLQYEKNKLVSKSRDLKFENQKFMKKVDGVQYKVDGLQAKVGGLNAKFDGFTANIDGCKDMIADLKAEMNKKFAQVWIRMVQQTDEESAQVKNERDELKQKLEEAMLKISQLEHKVDDENEE
ncbi:hypothetical protein M3Y95_01161600 [Aphelenchoides besseyi]|nr:hypothetical protein M3Y95_01161600 [Aphelenchoides besseyi]